MDVRLLGTLEAVAAGITGSQSWRGGGNLALCGGGLMGPVWHALPHIRSMLAVVKMAADDGMGRDAAWEAAGAELAHTAVAGELHLCHRGVQMMRGV